MEVDLGLSLGWTLLGTLLELFVVRGKIGIRVWVAFFSFCGFSFARVQSWRFCTRALLAVSCQLIASASHGTLQPQIHAPEDPMTGRKGIRSAEEKREPCSMFG